MLNMKKTYVPITLDAFMNESKSVNLKRKYGNSPSVNVATSAPLRNQVLNFVSENARVSRSQLRQFISNLNENNSPAATTMWMKRNAQFFVNESKAGITFYKLSTLGKRLVSRFDKNILDESINERDEADFYDMRKGYPRPGITDADNEEIVDDEDSYNYEYNTAYESKKEKVEKVLETLRRKKQAALLEEESSNDISEDEDEEKDDDLDMDDSKDDNTEGEDKETSEEDEFNLDDLDVSNAGDEGDEAKVEITEFILTVDNPDEAIAELAELGIEATKVEAEEAEETEDEESAEHAEGGSEEGDIEGEGNENIGDEGDVNLEVNEAEEGEEGLDLETGGDENAAEDTEDDLGSDPNADIDLGDENTGTEGQIKVNASDWEALKGWLEGKGVDVGEMFGGDIEMEDSEELEGEETGDEDLDLDDETEEVEDTEEDINLE